MDRRRLSFYKNKPSDKTIWVTIKDRERAIAFTFDKKKIYFLYQDYPHKLTPAEKEIFDRENPFWVDFFS